MTEDNKRQNIALEVARAQQDLDDAKFLRSAGRHASAVSRAYYSMFHHARALIFLEGLEVRSHSGVIHLINLHFVRTGRLSPDIARFLSMQEKLRQDADYDSAAVFTEGIADDTIQAATRYADAATSILGTAGYLP